MNSAWKELGVKERYDVGELIAVSASPQRPFQGVRFSLIEERSAKRIPIEVKEGPGHKHYIEFYALETGRYQIEAPWGNALFEVVPRRDLNFQTEFGIFFLVVVLMVAGMARRYIFKKKTGEKHEAH